MTNTNTNTDLVSVIIPCYNVSSYVDNLHFVFKQTYPAIELVLIDDCSTDDTWAKIQNFKQQHVNERVIVARNEHNQGAGKTRNLGVKLSTGKFVCFWDADDQVEPTYVEKMLSKIKQEDADFVCCDIHLVNGNKSSVLELTPALLAAKNIKDIQKLFFDFIPSPCNKLVKREFILDKGIEFPDIFVCEDHCWGMLLTLEAHKISFVKEQLYHYIKRDNSLSSGHDKRFVQGVLDMTVFEYKTIIKYHLENELISSWKEYRVKQLTYFFNVLDKEPELLKYFAKQYLDFCERYNIDTSEHALPASAFAKKRLYRIIPPFIFKETRARLKKRFLEGESIIKRNELCNKLRYLALAN
ncbi:MAG TPA: glycosyltransferase [Candidatus Anaerobiospirillum pullistercoris]|uniref:Glycosyltransferase n=1 Tax=Candidatus Anaerobiospirillum pullistercoris TaxID=2838452 RepID=A0A9D2AZP1_9GAMM|nr:glycosyltransferase [Candidatus Anaerobiospirillum pullistercoris]